MQRNEFVAEKVKNWWQVKQIIYSDGPYFTEKVVATAYTPESAEMIKEAFQAKLEQKPRPKN